MISRLRYQQTPLAPNERFNLCGNTDFGRREAEFPS